MLTLMTSTAALPRRRSQKDGMSWMQGYQTLRSSLSAFAASWLSIDSENAWYSFVKRNYRHLFPELCSRSRFNRTWCALLQTTELLRQKMPSVFLISSSQYYVVDMSQSILKNNISGYLSSYQLDDNDRRKVCTLLGFNIKDMLIEKNDYL